MVPKGQASPIPEPLPHPPLQTAAATGLSPRARRRGLVVVLSSILAVGMTFGTSIPLIALLLDRTGVPAGLIGLNAAMPVLATLLVAPLIPSVIGRFGTLPTLFGALALIVCCFLLFPLFAPPWAWFPLRFLVGVGMAMHWVVSETWLNAATVERNRGFFAGVYATLFSLGFVAGPILLTVIEVSGGLPFYLIAGSVVLAAVPLAFARGAVPKIEVNTSQGSWSPLALAPTIFAAILVSGLVDGAILSLLPLYGLRKGLVEAEALLLLSIAIAGTVTLQIPLGWLADRVERRRLLLLAGAAGALGAALLPMTIGQPLLLWPLLFLWGGLIVGLYTLALAMLGDRFSGDLLARANALFVMTYCLGSAIGPPLAGTAMDLLSVEGFPASLSLSCLAFLALGLYRSWRRSR